MSKLTKKQKEFLKGIPNKKARQEQKIQFKLQNSYNGNIVFINGKFETDLEKLAHFMNGHPMMDIMFKEEFEEINGKGKTWYETSAKEVEEKWNEKVINGILSSEPTLTKEVLNDLTNPKNLFDKEAIERQIKFNEDVTNLAKLFNPKLVEEMIAFSEKTIKNTKPKTYSKGDMKKCFWNSRNLLNDVRETIWEYPDFEQYLKSLK